MYVYYSVKFQTLHLILTAMLKLICLTRYEIFVNINTITSEVLQSAEKVLGLL